MYFVLVLKSDSGNNGSCIERPVYFILSTSDRQLAWRGFKGRKKLYTGATIVDVESDIRHIIEKEDFQIEASIKKAFSGCGVTDFILEARPAMMRDLSNFSDEKVIKLNDGKYSIHFSGFEQESKVCVENGDDFFFIPFSRLTHYFRSKDTSDVFNGLKVFEKMTYKEFQNYFESDEDIAAPFVIYFLCECSGRPWWRDGEAVVTQMMARTSYCKNRNERLVAMFYDLVLENGLEVADIEDSGFNFDVIDALSIYEEAFTHENETDRIRTIVEYRNQLAITVKRYDFEYLIKRATERKSWNRRKKLQGYLDLLNTLCNDQRSSQ